MKKKTNNFIASIAVTILFPLIPLFLEYWLTSPLNLNSLILIAAIYPVTSFAASSHFGILYLSVVVCVIFSACYGFTVGTGKIPPYSGIAACVCVVATALGHIAERWFLHIYVGEPFAGIKS